MQIIIAAMVFIFGIIVGRWSYDTQFWYFAGTRTFDPVDSDAVVYENDKIRITRIVPRTDDNTLELATIIYKNNQSPFSWWA